MQWQREMAERCVTSSPRITAFEGPQNAGLILLARPTVCCAAPLILACRRHFNLPASASKTSPTNMHGTRATPAADLMPRRTSSERWQAAVVGHHPPCLFLLIARHPTVQPDWLPCRVEIVSAAFEGKKPVQRHRMVYQLLQAEIDAGVHALALKTKTPAEMRQQ